MNPRVREVIHNIREMGVHPASCFGPMRRGTVFPFIGGGTVTKAEYEAIMRAFYRPPQEVQV